MSRVINKEIEQVAIDLLKHHPRNANHGDVDAIKTSLAVNGWYGSVVVNTATKHILAGNHRVMAAKALGWETVPVQWVDVTPEEELRILVVDNRTTRIGRDDTTKITDILAELANTPVGLEGTGYSADDLNELINEIAGVWDNNIADKANTLEPNNGPLRFTITVSCSQSDADQLTNVIADAISIIDDARIEN